MRYHIRVFCFLLLVAIYSPSYGQIDDYNYKRELKGISDQWHKIILPNEIFGKTSQDLSDIRVFGLKDNNDTIEAPYLLRITKENVSDKKVTFKTLNTSYNTKGYYFTFEVPTNEPINQIKLDFAQENFDWLVKLEGSHDQDEWFTVIEDYRILSIKNSQTDYQFTKLVFPTSKYRYIRLLIDSNEKPTLNEAGIALNQVSNGTFRTYTIRKITTKENKQKRRTEIDVELQLPVRVNLVKINVSDTFDYYRPITIKYLSDSFRTEQGWKYNYNDLTSGTLTSLEENEFQFNGKTVEKLKILIENHDNEPLKIENIELKGYIHELVTRFTDTANYFLVYGNNGAQRPQYDIARFSNNIPEALRALELGNEVTLEKKINVTEPLFVNKTWLWVTMLAIILLLGWFTIIMIRKVL